MWRHGDVLIAPVDLIPFTASKRPGCVLAEGELTGHAHRIDRQGAADLYVEGNNLYLSVTADFATVVHEEHQSITLPRGTYRVWQQREYSPQAIHRVRD